jgi:hypothetical protein
MTPQERLSLLLAMTRAEQEQHIKDLATNDPLAFFELFDLFLEDEDEGNA